MKRYAMLLAGLLGAGLAQAQSHSVTNYSNPPGQQADSKAATDATPGLSATADAQDVHHAGKGTRDAQANKGKHRKPAAGTAHGGSGARGATASADVAASKSKSQSATAPVTMDGASKGGAEATMQAEPSERQVDDVSRHAFDTTPEKK